MKTTIAIAADHAAYQLKEQLITELKKNGGTYWRQKM